MTLRFGTDGIRGVAGGELTPELLTALGRVAADLLGSERGFLIGRDTRRSGPMLASALAAGVAASGVDVTDVGVIPTPGVAALCADGGCAGAMISASHNPFGDNGVKLFDSGGMKLDQEGESVIEAALRRAAAPGPDGSRLLEGASIGTIGARPGAVDWYQRRVLAALDGRRLGGIRVALDCAHGAASTFAAPVMAAAGAEVVAVLGAAPDGININAGVGSTDPSALASVVADAHADVGLAFDGDADRVIAVDGAGQVVDGDRLLALFAVDLQAQGRLEGGTVVVTVMTNLGFHRAMAAAGIAVHQTQVGDRNVLAALDANGWALGGEQSGHVIFRRRATTGDGLLSGLLLLDLMARAGQGLAALAEASMHRVPQVLRNVRVARPDQLPEAPAVWDAVRAAERTLGEAGRVLVRRSGTEKVVRVMVEAPTDVQAGALAEALTAAVTASLGSA